MLLYVFDMFHILLSGDSLRDLCNVCMYEDNKDHIRKLRLSKLFVT